MYSVRHHASFADLPERCAPLLQELAQAGLFGHPEWFDHLMGHFYLSSDSMRLYVVEDGAGRPLLLAPLRLTVADQAVPGGRLISAIGHPENYAAAALVFDAGCADRVTVLAALFRHLLRGVPGAEPACDALRLSPLDDGSALAGQVLAALARERLLVQVYSNSYNHYETTEGIDAARYLASRSANHRYSIRRRQRALEKTGALQLALYTGAEPGPEFDQALADYREVARASWKEADSMLAPGLFELLDLAARHGALRLGLLRHRGRPAATQMWIVAGGVAHCVRLAYHQDFKAQGVGVVLTHFMIAQVLERDRVRRIDFGFGNEDYKGDWMKQSRDLFGLVAFNPRTPRGLLHGGLNILGRPVKRGLQALLRHLRRQSAS